MANLVTNIRWSDNTQAVARNITAGLDVIGRSVGEVRQQVRDAAKTVQELEKALSDIKPSGKALVDLTAEIDRAKGAHAALKQELAALDPKAKGAAASLKSVGTEAAGAAKGLKDAGDGAKAAGEQAEKAKVSFQQVGASLTTLGRGMSVAITAPIVGAAAASVKFASDFETDMVKVHNLSGVTEADMQQMKGAILALGPAVGIGPDELAKAMLAVTSTGLTGAKAMEVLTLSAKASAVGMGDAATIARTITSIIKAYGEENMTAAHAAEVMFKIVKDGNAEASELAGSLGRVVGIASTLKIGFEDVGTFIATFTRIGVNTAEAVTALRAFIGNLELKKPSKDAIAALDSVGLTFDKLRKSINDVGLTATAIDLFERFKGREADLQPVIANVRALAGATGTYVAQAKDAVKIQEHMVQQTTELEDGFTRLTETGTFKWKALKAELEALAITIGDELLPDVKNLIDNVLKPGLTTVEGWVQAWKDLPEPVKRVSELVLALGAAGGPVLLGLGALARSISAIQLVLFGANAVEATSVAGFLSKFGIGALSAGAGAAVGGGAAAAGAGAGAVAGAAEGVGLTALQLKIRGISAPKIPGLGPLAMGGFMLGNSEMSLSREDAQAAMESLRRTTKIPAIQRDIALPKEGIGPLNLFGRDTIAGTRMADVEGTALTTLAEKVKALTAAEREEIKTKYEETGSIKAVAKETGIAQEVVSAFLHQQKQGAAGVKEYDAAWRELNATGATYRDTLASLKPDQIATIEYYLKSGNSVATLAKAFPNLTKVQIEAVDASLKLKLATVPLTDEQNHLALSLLRSNAAAGETIYSIEQIAKAAGAAPVQIKLLKATLDELAKVEKNVKLSGPIAGLTLTNPKQEIAAYRADLDKLTQAQHAAEDAQLSGVAAAVRAIERKRDADIKAIKEELGADEELKRRRIQLATDTATAQIALADGTSKDIVAITHALGLQTQSELQATVAKYKAEYETLKNAVTKDWEAIDAARKRYEEALAKSNAGEAFKQALEKSLKGIPDLLIKAFLGGGGLKGAVSALGVELGQVFAEGIARGVKQSKAGTPLPEGSEGPVKPGSGVNSTVLIGAGGVGGLAGAGAEASGATGKQAAGTVGLTAASIGAQVGIQAGSWTAGIAAGAATAGIGLAVVAAIEIYKAKHLAQWEKLGKDIGSAFGVSLAKDTLKAWEKEAKQFGTQATGLLHLDEIIAAAGGIAKFGFDKAAAGAHDLFSMLQTGKLTIDQVTSELDKLWPELAKGGVDAYGRISDKLKELIKLNQQYKTESKEIAAFLKQQGSDAIDGFNGVVAAQDTQLKKYDDIKKGVEDASAAVQKLHTSSVDYLGILGKMKPDEYQSLAKAFGAAQASGFKGDIVAFFQQQATLYRSAKEGDPRLKTFLYGDTLKELDKQEHAAADAVSQVIDQMQGAEKTALQDGYAQALQDGFKGTLADFLLQQNQLYGVAKEGDARLKTWLSGRTIDQLNAIPAVQEYNKALKSQQEAAAAAKDELADLGIEAVAAYTAAVASGTSPADALKAISPSLTTIQKEYEDLGLDIDDVALKALIMQNKIATANPSLISGVSGLAKEFVALDNMGLLNAETFAAMQRTGAKMFERLKAGAEAAGGTTKDALIPIQQWLHEAEDAAKKYGYQLDDATQAMIDMSKEEGIWKDEDPTADKEKGMRDLIDAVHDLVDALRGIPPKTKTTIEIETKRTETGPPATAPPPYIPAPGKPPAPLPGEPSPTREPGVSTGGRVTVMGIQRFAQGGIVGPDTIPAMVSPGELIANTAQQATIGRMLAAGVAMAASLALATSATWKIPDLPRGRDLIPDTLAADRATDQQQRTGDFLRTGTVTPMQLVSSTTDGGGGSSVAIDMKPTIYLTSDDTKDPDRVLDILKVGLRDDRSLIRTAVEKVALKAVENAS